MTEEKKAEEKSTRNPWMYTTVVLVVIVLAVSALSFSGMITGNVIEPGDGSDVITGDIIKADEIGELALDFFNTMLSQTPGTLVRVDEVSGVYQVFINVQGQEVPLYFTKDGYWIGQGQELMSITELPDTSEPQQQQPEAPTEINEAELSEFISCLNDAGFKVYGANWCTWTKKLVTMLGGFDMVEPIYVECTENQEICDNESISGFPTIKINGELYGAPRTFEAFSGATGCPVPSGAVAAQAADSGSGGC